MLNVFAKRTTFVSYLLVTPFTSGRVDCEYVDMSLHGFLSQKKHNLLNLYYIKT